MAKKEEATETPVQEAEPKIQLTFEQMQSLMTGAMAAFVEAQKAPTATEKERKRREKLEWNALIKSINAETVRKQSECSHMHKHAKKSMVARAEICFPRNGWMLICQNCFKTWTNYDKETHVPAVDRDFEKWWNVESLVEQY